MAKMPPFIEYEFDVSPSVFAGGAVAGLVRKPVKHQERVWHVESATQTGDSTAKLILKPGHYKREVTNG